MRRFKQSPVGVFGDFLLALAFLRQLMEWVLELRFVRVGLEMANLGQAVDFVIQHLENPGWLGNGYVQLAIIALGLGLIFWDRKRPNWLPSPEVSPRQMILGGIAIALLGLIVAAIGVWQQQSVAPQSVEEDRGMRSEITTLFNSTVKPASDAENNVLQRVLALMAQHPDKNVDAFAGLVQRSVIDPERAALSRLNNALTGKEIVTNDDLQERTGSYYREYQVGRTYIAKSREIGIDLNHYAMFDEWKRLDRSFLDTLRQFSAHSKYNLLRTKIEEVGWGEGVTASLSKEHPPASPTQPAMPQSVPATIPQGSAASDIDRRLLEISDLERYVETMRSIRKEGDAIRADENMKQISSSTSNIGRITANIVRLRDRAIAASSREAQIYQKYQFTDIQSTIQNAPSIAIACNELISLLDGLMAPVDLKNDIYDQPAYQVFSDTIDEIGSWIEQRDASLKSFKRKYEEAQANGQ